MSKTTEDLKAAFAGESQANRKYLYYAQIAEKEGSAPWHLQRPSTRTVICVF